MKRFFSQVGMGLFCALLLAGCGNEEAKLKKVTPKDTDAMARNFIMALNKKDTASAEKLIDAKVRTEAKDKLKNLVQLLSSDKIQEVKIIGVRIRQEKDQKLVLLNYQIYYPKAWVLSSFAVLESSASRGIVSVRMDPLPKPLEQLYAFKLTGKSVPHYIVLLFSIFVPLFIAYVLYLCVKSQASFKWLWIPFIALGLASFHLDWTSGRAVIQPLSVLVFGVLYRKQKYAPLIISVGLPLGAIVFFVKNLLSKPKAQPSVTSL